MINTSYTDQFVVFLVVVVGLNAGVVILVSMLTCSADSKIEATEEVSVLSAKLCCVYDEADVDKNLPII